MNVSMENADRQALNAMSQGAYFTCLECNKQAQTYQDFGKMVNQDSDLANNCQNYELCPKCLVEHAEDIALAEAERLDHEDTIQARQYESPVTDYAGACQCEDYPCCGH